MTVGFRNSAGVDFDSLFDPYVTGTPPAATGFRDASNVDLAGRYAPIAVGSAGAATGFLIASGADVSTLWAAIGTAAYVNIIGAEVLAAGFAPEGTQASYLLTSAGQEQTKSGTAAASTINTWLLSGAAGDYDVRFTVTGDDGGGTLTGSGAGVWLNLATTRSWSYGDGVIGSTGQLSALVEIRRVSSGVVLGSAVVQLNTERL